MRDQFAYDTRQDPPAPVLPLRIGRPGDEPALSIIALVDTGADTTVIPEDVPRRLKLPVVEHVRVRGVGGASHVVQVHSIAIEIAGFRATTGAIALGSEALVGRDLLNQWTVTLRGPQQMVEVETSGPRPETS